MIKRIKRRSREAISALGGPGYFASILRGGGQVAALRIAGAGLAFAYQVLLTRWLGPDQMGLYVYAMTWVSILGLIAGAGLPNASLRFVPKYTSSRDLEKLAGFFLWTRKSTLVIGLTILGATWIVLATIVPQGIEYREPLQIAALCVPLLSLTTLLSEQSRSLLNVFGANFPIMVLRPLILLAVSGGVWSVTNHLTTAQALKMVIFAQALIVIVMYWTVRKTNDRLMLRPKSQPTFEKEVWLKVSLPLLIVSGFQIVLGQMDILMIGAFLTSADISIYNACLRIAVFCSFGLSVLNARTAPTISHLYEEGKPVELQTIVNKCTIWSAIPAAVLTCILILAGPMILNTFGATFGVGHLPLVILAVGQTINASSGPVGFLLTMTGNQNTFAAVLFVSALVNILLNYLLVPVYGLVGAAIATSTSIALWNVVLWWIAMRKLKIFPIWIQMFTTDRN